MSERVDHLELLRSTRRAAGDRRKLLLTLTGLLVFLSLSLAILALGRAAVFGGFLTQLEETFLRPVVAATDFFRTAFAGGEWTAMVLVLLGIWLAAMLVNSFLGLAVTRMLAVEITCGRRPDVSEAIGFARRHWIWGFVTPASLLFAALFLLGLAALLFRLAGSLSDFFLLFAVPVGLMLVVAAAFMLMGLLGGGILAGPTIATEWSDAFDAITRVYGYGFAHTYRLFLYRAAGGLVLLGEAFVRALRAALVFGMFYLVLLAGLGAEHTRALADSILEETPEALPWPQTVAAWTLLLCAAGYLTATVARLLVFRLALRQAIYLRLRLHIDKVPLDSIDGYRPDDSAFDPTAQGFELVEVEEEIPAE